MNEVVKAIMTRRSIRSYDARAIPRDVLQTIIEAGNEAPSAMNSQPWRFVVVETQDVKRKLLGAALPQAKKITELVKTLTLYGMKRSKNDMQNCRTLCTTLHRLSYS
jgi:nitroreductase